MHTTAFSQAFRAGSPWRALLFRPAARPRLGGLRPACLSVRLRRADRAGGDFGVPYFSQSYEFRHGSCLVDDMESERGRMVNRPWDGEKRGGSGSAPGNGRPLPGTRDHRRQELGETELGWLKLQALTADTQVPHCARGRMAGGLPSIRSNQSVRVLPVPLAGSQSQPAPGQPWVAVFFNGASRRHARLG